MTHLGVCVVVLGAGGLFAYELGVKVVSLFGPVVRGLGGV